MHSISVFNKHPHIRMRHIAHLQENLIAYQDRLTFDLLGNIRAMDCAHCESRKYFHFFRFLKLCLRTMIPMAFPYANNDIFIRLKFVSECCQHICERTWPRIWPFFACHNVDSRLHSIIMNCVHLNFEQHFLIHKFGILKS